MMRFVDRIPFGIKTITENDTDFHAHGSTLMYAVLKGMFWNYTPCFDDSGKKLTEVASIQKRGNIRFYHKNKQHRMELISNKVTIFYIKLPF